MERIGFIGAYDKTDFIMYIAKILVAMDKKVLVVDSTINQKAKYVVPAINPTTSYFTEFEEIDVAVGFHTIKEMEMYLGINDLNTCGYNYVLIDIDSIQSMENFHIESAVKNFFITSFDLYSLKRGLEILSGIRQPIELTKVLFSKNMTKEEDDYLNFLSLGYKITWNETRIYFPVENGDQTAIIENQRVSKIKLKNLSVAFKDSLQYVIETITNGGESAQVRKAMKLLEKGV